MAKYCGKDLLIQRAYVPIGAWTATTAYTAAQVVTNSGNVYECVVAGTSAGSGGPTGTTASITDGTVTWRFISVVTSGNGYLTIAGMRSTSLSINNEQVDVTDKGDVPWRQLLECGVQSMELSASGMFSDAIVARQLMGDVVVGACIQTFRVISGAGDIFLGLFQITTLERNGEYNGAEQYSLSLASAGTITYTPAP